tara:strand:- start:506 stop:943 length:438 start_codon:yes stop_codon:yes gene_type:complete
MEEEFYAIIKLISGEEIFSLVSIEKSDDNSIVIMQNPVVMKTFNSHGNSLIKIKPWIELSTEDIFVIRYDRIITMTETKDEKVIEIYNRYLSSEDGEISSLLKSPSSKVNISEKMGYLNSVEDAREQLENIFKIPPADPDLKDLK